MAQSSGTAPASQIKTSPLRLLVLAPIRQSQTLPSPFPSFLQRLTGSSPPPDVSTFAGYTSHPALNLKTKYFEADVTIWCDELPSTTQQDVSTSEKDNDKPSSPEATLTEWTEQMLSTSAREVREVIGGIILLLPFSSTSTSTQPETHLTIWLPYLEATSSLRDAIEEDSGRDVASVVVLQDMSTNPPNDKANASLLEQAEDEYLTVHGIMGWDYVLWTAATDNPQSNTPTPEPTPLNAHGEKTSIPRLLEVLSNIDWTANPTAPSPTYSPASDEDADAAPTADFLITDTDAATKPSEMKESLLESSNEFQREMLGIKMAMLDIRAGRDDNSGPSSLAGELDATDLGLRTPAPARGLGRPSGLSRTVSSSTGVQGDEMQVDQLSGLMERVVAMREAAGELSGPEKEAFARREVARIMRELG